VEPVGAPTLAYARAAGAPVDAPAGSIAVDALAPRRVGELVFPITQAYVADVVTSKRGARGATGSPAATADWFPEADHVFPLDPSYEPLADPRHPEHEGIFAQLTGRQLTPLGKHYWRLARKRSI